MKRRAFGKGLILLLSLVFLWLGIGYIARGFSSTTSLFLHLLNQITGWGLVLFAILGILFVVALVKRDSSLF